MTPLKALHIDRRQHLELAWQRQQGEEELLKQHLTVKGPTVIEVRTLAHLDQLVDSAGSAIVLLYFYSKVEKADFTRCIRFTTIPPPPCSAVLSKVLQCVTDGWTYTAHTSCAIHACTACQAPLVHMGHASPALSLHLSSPSTASLQ